MAHLTVQGRELFHQRRGSGEPLLLIQGMSGTHLSWGDPFLERLDGFDVVSYDHRGIGRSARIDDPFSIVDLAEDAAGLLDAVGWESAHVLGISMGGMVAQELALRHPQRIRTLTLGCTYCGGPGSALAPQATIERLSAGMMSGDKELAIRTAFEVNVSAAFAARDGAYDTFRAMAGALPAPVPVIMLQMQAVAGHDTSARLPSLAAPTLVIHGDEDQMLPVDNGRLIASLVPGARLAILEGVAHMFWWEQSQRSAELLCAHARAGAAF
ncbi:MAG TPA: alpha/beta fold hydrolase [Baekduia sp.]|uniref:alpha/beta fold hydrolase n=1 Tax=Baekduia sp. TaxID=2600305 RepID=UPI002C943396|nr:alpha/beta fold hydrolase [Baekduia sp.]HMJ36914.1 alpha/beta fold hydrolase [Baekduia sp.]